MALTSTLFTGLSGLDVNQTRLNVVGNNIANTNTVAFKSSRALFKPQFYVTDSPGTAPDGAFGGANPNQRGLGAQVSSIEKDFTQGPIEPTGRKTDIAIDGNGFFVVGEDEHKFTRDGSFNLNDDHELITSNGEYVQGYGVDSDYNVIPNTLGRITVPLGGATAAQASTEAKLNGNLDASGDLSTGASVLNSQVFKSSTGALTNTTPLSTLQTSAGTPLFGASDTLTLQGKKGEGNLPATTFDVAGKTWKDFVDFLNTGLGIDTTQNVGATGKAGISVKPDPANATDPTAVVLTVTGNTGTQNALALTQSSLKNQNGSPPFSFLPGTDVNGNADGPVGESTKAVVRAYDSLGTEVTVDVTLALQSRSDAGTIWSYTAESAENTGGRLIGTGSVSFGNTGQLLSATPPTIEIKRDNTGAVPSLPLKLDFTQVTALTDRLSVVTGTADGNAKGTLTDFSIGDDGTIKGAFDNGLTKTVGKLALATFKNSLGLQDTGSNLFKTGANSGDPQITAPKTLEAGVLKSGSLELSNVDLSKEFTNLIIASTGFSASSRVISTSSQLLTELLNTAR